MYTVFGLHRVKCKNNSILNNSVYRLNLNHSYLTQSGATIPGQSLLGSDGNEGVLCIL